MGRRGFTFLTQQEEDIMKDSDNIFGELLSPALDPETNTDDPETNDDADDTNTDADADEE